MSNYSLEVKRTFKASAETIYNSWLDPKAISEFMRPVDEITVPAPEIDARVGGAFSFDMHSGEEIYQHKGKYKIIDKPNKIQFSWNSTMTNNEDSIVTITINPIDNEACELTLQHELLPTESTKNDHTGGWTNILKTLAAKI